MCARGGSRACWVGPEHTVRCLIVRSAFRRVLGTARAALACIRRVQGATTPWGCRHFCMVPSAEVKPSLGLGNRGRPQPQAHPVARAPGRCCQALPVRHPGRARASVARKSKACGDRRSSPLPSQGAGAPCAKEHLVIPSALLHWRSFAPGSQAGSNIAEWQACQLTGSRSAGLPGFIWRRPIQILGGMPPTGRETCRQPWPC